MAVISVARSQTTAEALGPIVADLFESIDRSKKLRGERLQFESVFKSLDSLGEEATPEEKMAAVRGALQQVRTQSRDQNEGFLARIIKGLDPRVPSFGEGVTPIEKFVADQQLGIAFSDTRLLDSQIELNKQRAAELERRPETGGGGAGRGLTGDAAKREGVTLGGIKESVPKKGGMIGFRKKRQVDLIKAFEEATRSNPTMNWALKTRNERIDSYNIWVANLLDDADSEWDRNSKPVKDLVKRLFGTEQVPKPDEESEGLPTTDEPVSSIGPVLQNIPTANNIFGPPNIAGQNQPTDLPANRGRINQAGVSLLKRTGGQQPSQPTTAPAGMPVAGTQEELDQIPVGTDYWHTERSPFEGPLTKQPGPDQPANRVKPRGSFTPGPKF